MTRRRGMALTSAAVAAGLVAGTLVAPGASAAPAPARPAAVKVTANRSKPANPVPPPVTAAIAAARQRHSRVEVTADRTAYAQTFANPNGTLTSVISAQPRWVRQGSSWVAASADLVRSQDGSWSPKAAQAGLRFSGGGNQVLATVSSAGHSMSVSWPSALPAPQVSGASATYASVFPGVDLVVTAQVTGGFTETLVIRDAAAAKDPQLQGLTLGVSLSGGLSQHAGTDGSAVVRDPSGKAVFSSPTPVAWDSAARPGGPASSVAGPGPAAHVAKAAASYGPGSVRLSVPGGLLSGPSVAYPVYVDPGWAVNNAATDYGEMQSAYPTTNELNSTFDGNVAVGYDGNSVDRGDYNFALPSVYGPSVNVISATMTAEAVATFTSSSVAHTVNLYQTSPYTSSTTWNSPPTQQDGPSAQTFTTASTTPNQNVTWNVASWLQPDLHNQDTEFSTELINSDETTSGGSAFVKFSSSPLLSFTFDEVPSVAPGSGPVPNGTFLSFPISDRVSLRVNVGSGNALVTTSDLTLPETGSSLTLGAAYNSLLAGASVTGDTGAYGWTQRQGSDVGLYPASDGSVTFIGPDGTAGKFTAASGGGYTSPPVFHATLAKSSGSTCGGTGWTLTWHQSGQVMCFNTSGWLTSQADRNGNTTAFRYNSDGKETSITFTPHGASAPTQTVNVTRSSCTCLMTGMTESGGSAGTKTVTYNLDSSTNNLASLTQPDNTTISFGYDSSHNLTSIQNGDNNTTQLTYNSSHQVTSVTQPATSGNTATTRLSYVSATETQVADPNTSQSQAVSAVPNTTYTIDSASSLVTKTVDQAGDTRSTSYTPFNDVASSTNGQTNGTTTNTYGANSGESLTASKSPTGATVGLAYNNSDTATNPTASFQPSSGTDAQNNATAYTYDGPGNLAQASNALAATAKVTHNSDGTPATSTDPANGTNATTYSYNSAHQLTKVTPPTGSSLQPASYTYDGFGRVATVTDGNGNTVTYTYDLADRITQAAYTGGSAPVTVTYGFDGAGNLKTQTDPSGTISYTYDPRNLVLTRTATSGGGTLSYGYDLDGNLASVADAGGTTSYTYNSRNLLTQLTDPAGNLWQFAYNPAGERINTWFATNTAETTWAAQLHTVHDSGGRIVRIQAFENSSTANVASDTSYCYSKYVSGQSCPIPSATTDTSLVQYATNNKTSTVSQYTYDKGNRLTSATNIGGKTYSYGYDADGNVTTGAVAGSLTYNSGNQVTTSGYGYDGAGNLTATPGNGTLSYNDAGQMTSASNAGGTGAENFSYAGSGQNQVLSDSSATGITYGLAGQTGQPWVQSYTPAGSTSPVYVLHDQQGTPLGYVQGGKSYAWVTDNIGSVFLVIGTSGTSGTNGSVAGFSYDPYGHITGTLFGSVPENLIRYAGGLADPTSGYTHFGQRWYNPATGAFTTQDSNSYLGNPANGNRYAYAASNPVNYIDPSGRDFCYLSNGIMSGVGIPVALAGTGVGIPYAVGALEYGLACPYANWQQILSTPIFTT